ncbi:olfactory receptor 6N1-like [Mixophyes fleayi]|uniref:olfactory receptor 6N1-like n=1 Tax=Mixophyes fleayi TaxID=3061075 RepID=UPI003F4DA3C8
MTTGPNLLTTMHATLLPSTPLFIATWGNIPESTPYPLYPLIDHLKPGPRPPGLGRSGNQSTSLRASFRSMVFADLHRSTCSFKVEDSVWLSTRNIRLCQPCKKLGPKFIGPFTILKQVNPVAFKLKLPESLKLPSTFHCSLLKPARSSRRFKPQQSFRLQTVLVHGHKKFVVEKILDSKKVHDSRRDFNHITFNTNIQVKRMITSNASTFTEFWLVGLQNLHGIRIFLFILLLAVYAVVLTGNLLIVYLVLSRSHLHSPMYFFLSNLSSSEIMFTTNIVPKFLKVLWCGGDKISINECFTQFYVCGSLAATECFLLTVMSYDRYVAICNPLHYNSLMTSKNCHLLASMCWAGGFFSMLTTLILVCRLHFCGSYEIDHFFCDFAPILDISCSDTFVVKLETFIFDSSVTLFPFIFIIGTYICIIITILKIPSSTGRQKSFSTCSSHLAVVSTYYGTLITVYVVPTRKQSHSINKILSLMYTIVTPVFNPIIYSLRNKEIRTAILKILRKGS